MLLLTPLGKQFSHLASVLKQVPPNVVLSLNTKGTYTCRVTPKEEKGFEIEFLLRQERKVLNGSPFVSQKRGFPLKKTWFLSTELLAEASSVHSLGSWTAFGVAWELALVNDEVGGSSVRVKIASEDDYRQGACQPIFRLSFEYSRHSCPGVPAKQSVVYPEVYFGSRAQGFGLMSAPQKAQWFAKNSRKSNLALTVVLSIVSHPSVEAEIRWRRDRLAEEKEALAAAVSEQLTRESLAGLLERLLELKEEPQGVPVPVEETFLSARACISSPEEVELAAKDGTREKYELLRHRGLVPSVVEGDLPWDPKSAVPVASPLLELLLEVGFLLIDYRSLFLHFLKEALGKDPSQEVVEGKNVFVLSHSYPLQQPRPASLVSLRFRQEFPALLGEVREPLKCAFVLEKKKYRVKKKAHSLEGA